MGTINARIALLRNTKYFDWVRCGCGEIGKRIGLKRNLSAPPETAGVELLNIGEALTGNPERSCCAVQAQQNV